MSKQSSNDNDSPKVKGASHGQSPAFRDSGPQGDCDNDSYKASLPVKEQKR